MCLGTVLSKTKVRLCSLPGTVLYPHSVTKQGGIQKPDCGSGPLYLAYGSFNSTLLSSYSPFCSGRTVEYVTLSSHRMSQLLFALSYPEMELSTQHAKPELLDPLSFQDLRRVGLSLDRDMITRKHCKWHGEPHSNPNEDNAISMHTVPLCTTTERQNSNAQDNIIPTISSPPFTSQPCTASTNHTS